MCSMIKTFATLSLLSLTLSCAHRAKIKLVGQFRTTEIPASKVPLELSKSNWVEILNKNYKKGFCVAVFSSSLDLGKLIKKSEMAHVYYRMRVCGAVDRDEFFYGQIFQATTDDLEPFSTVDHNRTYYVAYLPVDYEEGHLDNLYLAENEEALKEQGACLKIGAGAMHGPRLTSNSIIIEYPKP